MLCTGAWAFNLVVSLSPDASSNQLLARYGGLVETDVEHPGWCGAERATFGAAEMTAVLKALVWIPLRSPQVLCFFTDRKDTPLTLLKEGKLNLRIRGLFPSPSFFTCGFPVVCVSLFNMCLLTLVSSGMMWRMRTQNRFLTVNRHPTSI